MDRDGLLVLAPKDDDTVTDGELAYLVTDGAYSARRTVADRSRENGVLVLGQMGAVARPDKVCLFGACRDGGIVKVDRHLPLLGGFPLHVEKLGGICFCKYDLFCFHLLNLLSASAENQLEKL